MPFELRSYQRECVEGLPHSYETGHRAPVPAANNRAVDAALRNAAALAGGTRSERAFWLSAALKRAGWSFTDVEAALLACAATAAVREKMSQAGERQFEGVGTRAADATPTEDRAAENNATTIWIGSI